MFADPDNYLEPIRLQSYHLDELNSKSFDADHLLINSFKQWTALNSTHLDFKANHFFICNRRGQMLYSSNLAYADDEEINLSKNHTIQLSIATKKNELQIIERNPRITITVMPLMYNDSDLVGLFGQIINHQTQFNNIDSIRKSVYSFIPFVLLAYSESVNKQLKTQKKQIEQETKRKEKLFDIVQMLHSLIDVESVLTEVVERIKELYPMVEMNLLTSQDNLIPSLPIKTLDFFSGEDDICTKSFMEGIQIHRLQTDSSESEIASPLSGKQGVYGVLHLKSLPTSFGINDIQFIQLLANAAGSAFENAKLHEHSNFLVQELRLINEITTRLNQSLKLTEIFNFASNELIKIFDADYSCILQVEPQKNEMVVKASNLPELFQEKFALDYGFSGSIYATKEPVIILDYPTDSLIQSKMMDLTESRSLIASPIISNGTVVGVCLVTHRTPNFFSYDNYKLLQILSSHIGLTIANASLHAEVNRMVITDNLTGLYARHYLDEQVILCQKKDLCGSLIVVDIDNFKHVNDTFGHLIGDQILIQVSGIIKTCIRDTDIAARWGGEELAIYLPQVTIKQAVRVAERIRNRVLLETKPSVTVSCGVSDWNWEDEKISVEVLFYKTDMALYKAKHEGKNKIITG